MNKRFRIVQTNTWTGSRKLENLCSETLNTRILGFFLLLFYFEVQRLSFSFF